MFKGLVGDSGNWELTNRIQNFQVPRFQFSFEESKTSPSLLHTRHETMQYYRRYETRLETTAILESEYMKKDTQKDVGELWNKCKDKQYTNIYHYIEWTSFRKYA